jgi:ABC-type Fe3+-hydroxamate transport system substrate-binding protein
MDRAVQVPVNPQRIVSLVPSQTELLYDLGLGDRVVGITKFCIHPKEWFTTKTRVGGTKNLNVETIVNLQPDLIIGNKEENERVSIEQLMQQYPVWMSDITTITDAKQMITQLGLLTGTSHRAANIVADIDKGFAQVPNQNLTRSVLYLIWRKPYMAAGTDTFINHVLRLVGFENVLADDTRYPEITAEEIATTNPQYILLSSEPYPFNNKHIAELQAIAPNAKILLVDGEMFSWYGSRLTQTGPYLATLLNNLK